MFKKQKSIFMKEEATFSLYDWCRDEQIFLKRWNRILWISTEHCVENKKE